MSYQTELLNKQFIGNVVIRILGEYYCIRQPDSGLSIPAANRGIVASLTVNPTTIDLKRVNSTIASYGFRLVDRDGIITALAQDRAAIFFGQQVEIWIGRTTGSFDFADYFKLPTTRVKKIEHIENAYNFSTSEETDRMNVPIFNLSEKLAASIVPATTTLTMQGDISAFPTSGMLRVDSEFISWSGKDNGLKQLTGCVRGEKGTTPADHDAGANAYNVVDVSANPIDLLLQILISDGGGGIYDVLPDGLGIDPSLIDVAGIEDLRDAIFPTETFAFSLYNMGNALRFLENEILLACNLRLVTSDDSKISLALLDQSLFGDAPDQMDEDSIASYPKWTVEESKIINQIEIQWDFDEGSQQYLKLSTYQDADSIAEFGDRPPLKLRFKGIQSSLSGQAIADDRADRLLQRFATPTPEISLKTHIDKSLVRVGQKVLVESSQIPAASGTLQFATELEVLSRAINFLTGDVTFKLAFTSYSGIRACYIAPSDLVLTSPNQKTITVAAGRGGCYEVGWKMRLWLHDVGGTGGDYEADPVNEIVSISGDQITFADDFVSTLIPSRHRIKFANYDEVTIGQRRFCFISDDGNNFDDGSSTYRITF